MAELFQEIFDDAKIFESLDKLQKKLVEMGARVEKAAKGESGGLTEVRQCVERVDPTQGTNVPLDERVGVLAVPRLSTTGRSSRECGGKATIDDPPMQLRSEPIHSNHGRELAGEELVEEPRPLLRELTLGDRMQPKDFQASRE